MKTFLLISLVNKSANNTHKLFHFLIKVYYFVNINIILRKFYASVTNKNYQHMEKNQMICCTTCQRVTKNLSFQFFVYSVALLENCSRANMRSNVLFISQNEEQSHSIFILSPFVYYWILGRKFKERNDLKKETIPF